MKKNYIFPFLWMKGEPQEVIREEIEKIDECGIKAICLESRPHPDFMGPKWWDDFGFIIAEAKQRDMKIWILDDAHFPTGYANGLIRTKYPERKKKYLRINAANVWGKTGEVTVNIHQMTKPLTSFLDLGKPVDEEERGKNKLVAVIAYPLREESKLDEDGAIDLTDKVNGDYLAWTFPKQAYRLYVVYETATDGGKVDYMNMMDKESVSTLIEAVYEPHYMHFKEEFGETIAGFFSDEPEIGNIDGFSSDTQIGNPHMALPWSKALKKQWQEVWGDAWRSNLIYLWHATKQMDTCPQARYSFMNIVTSLYRENFSRQLGMWCQEHGVEYIGHVVEDDNLHQRLGNGTGHYFRAMAGQHMAGIDIIGDQVKIGDRGYRSSGIFERDGAFFHYALAKLGASEGHLNPQKQGRTMCELFGASGWHTGVRDMKFILDHLLVRGINYLVPHAFSMGAYPDGDCPPHFYARGNNPQFQYFAELMKYANRMCDHLNGGQHMAEVAILYPAESEWGGMAMPLQEPARVLQEHQVEFDFVSADMLGNPAAYNGMVGEAGITLNGQVFHTIIVPEVEFLPQQMYELIRENSQMKVVLINSEPRGVVGDSVTKEELEYVLRNAVVIPLGKLGGFMQQQRQDGLVLVEPSADLVYYHYYREQDIYVFHNESAYDAYRSEISLPFKHGAVYYDGMQDRYYQLPVTIKDGRQYVEIELHPYGLGVIFDRKGEEYPQYQTLEGTLAECERIQAIEGEWRYSLASAAEYPNFQELEVIPELKPISDIIPEFSGHICYEKEFTIENVRAAVYLEFAEVYENIELWINDQRIGARICPPYLFDITAAVAPGINHLRAVVTTTLDRDQLNYPAPPVMLDYHVSEPTGLSGAIRLHYS